MICTECFTENFGSCDSLQADQFLNFGRETPQQIASHSHRTKNLERSFEFSHMLLEIIKCFQNYFILFKVLQNIYK